MKKRLRTILLVTLIAFIIGCGRHQGACIVNNTPDTLKVELILIKEEQNPNSYRLVYRDKTQEGNKDFKLPGDCLLEFDTITGTGTFILYPNDKLKLGTIPMDQERNDFRSWEFSKIKVTGSDYLLIAEQKGIVNLAKEEFSFFTQHTYFIYLGND